MVESTRRRFLQGAGTVTIAGIAGCSGTTGSGGGDGGGGTTTVEMAHPSGTVYEAYTPAAVDEGIFENQGIDMQAGFKPFPAYAQSLGKEFDVGLYPLLPQVSKVAQGEDLVLFGFNGSLLGFNSLFSLSSSDYETIPDLEGQTVGVWSFGSSTVQSFQGVVSSEFDLDLKQDFETTTAAPPALKGLLDKGDIDAAIEISSLTIALLSSDKYRKITSLNDVWSQQSGSPLPITSWIATRDWYENNTDVAQGLVTATNEATTYFRNNIDSIMDEYGKPAKVDNQAKRDVVKDLAGDELIFGDSDLMSSDFLDSTYDFFGLMNDQGFLDSVPSREDLVADPL